MSENFNAWDAKREIAHSIIPILESYKQLFESDKAYSLPNWVSEPGELLSEKEMDDRWVSYIEQMILAFKVEIIDLGYDIRDKELIQNKGLALFSKYYMHLWD